MQSPIQTRTPQPWRMVSLTVFCQATASIVALQGSHQATQFFDNSAWQLQTDVLGTPQSGNDKRTTSSFLSLAIIHRQIPTISAGQLCVDILRFSAWQLYTDNLVKSRSCNHIQTLSTIITFQSSYKQTICQFSVGQLRATISVWQLYADNFVTLQSGKIKQTISSILNLAKQTISSHCSLATINRQSRHF